jgi:methionyl-tRNA formyltransferase
MRIIFNGQQAFGQAVLEALLQRGENIVGVYCAPDKEGRPIDPLKTYALEQGLAVHQPKSFKNPEVWEQMRSLKPDLSVMAYVTLFVPEEALNIPTHGTIQYHPSLLPDHKGPSSINWPIIFGKKKTGLSIFWPDNGLDTGPILLQKEVDISPDDTLGSLYFNHLFPMGIAAMLEAVDLVKAGQAPKVPQDPNAGSYEGWCRSENAEVDWNQTGQQIHNLIRGTNPQPGAWTSVQGNKLQLFDAALAPTETGGTPGEIKAINEQGILVSAQDICVLLQRVRPQGDKKIAASEFAAKNGLSAGAKLG